MCSLSINAQHFNKKFCVKQTHHSPVSQGKDENSKCNDVYQKYLRPSSKESSQIKINNYNEFEIQKKNLQNQ